MNYYETSAQRVTFGIAAVAMTAMTLAVLVLLPAEMRAYDPTSTLSGIVTAASAGVQSANLDTAWTPASASVSCTKVESDRAQEL